MGGSGGGKGGSVGFGGVRMDVNEELKLWGKLKKIFLFFFFWGGGPGSGGGGGSGWMCTKN